MTLNVICGACDSCFEKAVTRCPVCETLVCKAHITAIPFSMADVCIQCAKVLHAADQRYAV